VAPVEDVEIPLWLFAVIAESPEGKVVERRMDPFVTRTVIRIPAAKFDVLRGLSPAAYTLCQTPEVLVEIFGPVESPTDASAELLIVNSAAIRGAIKRTTTPRETKVRSVDCCEDVRRCSGRKRREEVRMCEMPLYKRHLNCTDVLNRMSRGVF
jgi:hypothetical protein